MSDKIGRNDPCPCGSGKKYKQCHLGSADDPAKRELPPTTEEVAQQQHQAGPGSAPAWTRYVPWVIAGLGGVSTLGLVATGTDGALAVGGGTVAIVGLWFLLGNPPPPRDDAGDPAALNFGRRE